MKKTTLLAVTAVFSLLLYGQQATQLNLMFNHLALSVRDVNRSADFYQGILNLTELKKETQTEGIRWFSLGEGNELHLISDLYYKRDTVITNKAIHLALTTSNFDQLLKVLDSKNVAYSDWTGTSKKVNIRSDGVKQVYLQDPDGYWIEINSVGQK